MKAKTRVKRTTKRKRRRMTPPKRRTRRPSPPLLPRLRTPKRRFSTE